MEKSNPYSFYVVLADGIMEIPQESNLSWITLFYALPKELVEKRTAYLELPRNIHQLLHSEEHRRLIESEAFLELVWDCYAWAAWQFFQVPGKGGVKHDIPGNWSNYSGDFPLWRLSYEIIKYFRQKFETDLEWSFQRLFLMDKDSELPWLSYQHFGNLVGNLTDMIVEEQNWQPMIDEIWNNRQVADYTGKNIRTLCGHGTTAVPQSTFLWRICWKTAQASTVSSFMILPIPGASLNPRYLPSRAWSSSGAS